MTLAVGQWYRIKPAKDIGGIPLIRIESVEPEVVVSDWESFEKKFKDTPISNSFTRPNPRRFSRSAAEASEMLRRCWTLVTPR